MSEAPKTEPIPRKYDSRQELVEAKTTDQQKEEVGKDVMKFLLLISAFSLNKFISLKKLKQH